MAIDLGDAWLKLGVDPSELNKGLDEAKANVNEATGEMEESTGKMSLAFGAVAAAAIAAGAAIGAAITDAVKAWTSTGDEVAKMARRTGWGVESLSELRYAAKIAGTELAEFELGTRRLSKAIIEGSEGSETMVQNFDALGIDLRDLRALSPEDQFWAVSMALADLQDPTLKAAIALELFGRTGTQMFPLLEEGAEGIAALREEAHTLGVTFDEETGGAAEELADAFTNVQEGVNGIKFAIAEILGPELTELIETKIKPMLIDLAEWIRNNQELRDTLVAMVQGIGWVVDAVQKLIEAFRIVNDLIPEWLKRVSPLHTLGDILTGQTGKEMGEAWRRLTGQTGPEPPGLMPGIEETYGSQASALLGGVQVVINGNMMGDEAAVRDLAQQIQPYLMEADRTTTFAHVNTAGYFGGSSAE